jgi:hypothetical protein
MRFKMDKEIIETYDVTDIVWKHPKNMPVVVNECRVHLTEQNIGKIFRLFCDKVLKSAKSI